MPRKIYIVDLTEEERTSLLALIKSGEHSARKLNRGRILLLADDVGWIDLSGGQTSMGNGSTYHQTPNLDRLAAEGMAFTSAYAMQNCAPSRASLLTGQYETRTGVHNAGPLDRVSRDTPLVVPPDADFIDPAAVTLAENLRRAGYVTAHFGKFDVTAGRADIVNHHGFDYNFGGSNTGVPGSYFASLESKVWRFPPQIGPEFDAFAAPYNQSYVNRYLAPFTNGNDPSSLVGSPKHLNDAMADAAVHFMQEHLRAGRPFFMHVAFHAVHTPIEPRADLRRKYMSVSSTDRRHRRPEYAALVKGMDQAMGRIIEFVDGPDGDGGNTSVPTALKMTITPEPATLALLGLGMLSLIRRRK